MSMIGNLARIPDATRELLLARPRLITRLLYPDLPEPPPKQPGFLSRLFGTKAGSVVESTDPVPPLEPLQESDSLSIDKTWHALHFLFSGTAAEGKPPADFLVAGGAPIGDVDVGYGPARCFTPAEVRSIAAFLEQQKEEELRARIDLKAMEKLDIYPSVWSEDTDVDEEWEYLVTSFREMKQFVNEAAQAHQSMIVYLN
jgi:hypothetical protein